MHRPTVGGGGGGGAEGARLQEEGNSEKASKRGGRGLLWWFALCRCTLLVLHHLTIRNDRRSVTDVSRIGGGGARSKGRGGGSAGAVQCSGGCP